MRRILKGVSIPALLAVSAAGLGGQSSVRTRPIALDSATRLVPTNARVLWVEYRGRRALKLAPLEGHEHDVDQEMAATLADADFTDGVIEVDIAGARRKGYSTTADSTGFKGIVGISFRIHGDSAERFYLRPENARVNDQLYRNRATQYEADPDYSWQRLRRDSPGVYESYADVESGAWTKLKIQVSGSKARLYVNDAAEPCLVVNDLKHGADSGKIALWARISSDAYFSNLKVTRK
jgi:hypothetical protein